MNRGLVNIPGLPTVHQASTPDEIAAIRRFRYRVYVDELKRKFDSTNEALREIAEPDDAEPHVWLLYVGTPEQILGTLRVRTFPAGGIPADLREAYELDRIPHLDAFASGELGRAMIDPSARGGRALQAMLLAAVRRGLSDGIELCFLSCLPGLARYYHHTLGGRAHGTRPFRGGKDGLEIPMMMVPDTWMYVQARSWLTPVAALVFLGHHRPEFGAIRAMLDASTGVIFAPERVWDEVAAARAPETFLGRLSEKSARALAEGGFVLRVPAGDPLVVKDRVQREMFVILDGELRARADEATLRTMGRGEVVGELAFFASRGTRSASVDAVVDARVLVVRRNRIDELTDSDPRSAAEILRELGHVITERWLAAGG